MSSVDIMHQDRSVVESSWCFFYCPCAFFEDNELLVH